MFALLAPWPILLLRIWVHVKKTLQIMGNAANLLTDSIYPSKHWGEKKALP